MMVKHQLKFATSLETKAFCLNVVIMMMDMMGISEEEAFKRVNTFWGGKDFSKKNDIFMLAHEEEEYWVKPYIMSRDCGGIISRRN